MHDLYIILSSYIFEITRGELRTSSRYEDALVHNGVVAFPHAFIPNNRYTEATVIINQDGDNKELASFLQTAQTTKSRHAPRVVIQQSRFIDDVETIVNVTYLVKFDVLRDEIVGLEQEDGSLVTPHSLTININITKLKEEIL